MGLFKKIISLAVVVAIGVACLSACNSPEPQEGKYITDPVGDSVLIPEEITGIICRVNTASYLAAMGKSNLIKGTYKYLKTNCWADYLYPGLGSAENFKASPTAESFLELNANLCIWSDKTMNASLRSQGISAITDNPNSAEDMKNTAKIIANIFGEDEWANNWISYFDNTMLLIETRLENVSNKKVVYYVHGAGNQGIYHTAAGGTASEMWIVQSGGAYATSNTSGFGIDMNAEALIEMNPDIVLIGGVYHESLTQDFYDNSYFSEINAVRNNQIVNVPVGIIPWDQYGVEYPLLCLWTAKTLYPELFSDIDIVAETMNFYNVYCNLNITYNDAQNIIDGKSPSGGSLIENSK